MAHTEDTTGSSSMLPPDLAVNILQHVPQQTRCSTCALVCRSWHTATASATSSINAELPRQYQLDSLGLWLQRHGMTVESLSIRDANHYPRHNFSVPLQHLQRLRSLDLHTLTLVGASTASSSTSDGYMSALTSLQIDDVHLHNDECIKRLILLTKLRHLQIDVAMNALNYQLVRDITQRALATQTLLTSLVYNSYHGSDSLFQGLSNLTQLQLLRVKHDPLSTTTLNSLPLGLRHLDIHLEYLQLAPITTPRIGELTSLQHLAIRGDRHLQFNSGLLRSLGQLKHIDLKNCLMVDENNVATLLAVLPQLQQLQHLSLAGSLLIYTHADRYAALVNNTQLAHLDLSNCAMPHNAVSHMFSTAQQHMALQTFLIGLSDTHYRNEAFNERLQWTVCEGALDCAVSRCPNLSELCLADTIDPDCRDITALEQLSGLSKLILAGSWVSDVTVAGVVELNLPALKDLSITAKCAVSDSDWTAQGVLCLRSMTQLTRLWLSSSDNLYGDGDGDMWKEFKSQAGLTDLCQRMNKKFSKNQFVREALRREHNQGIHGHTDLNMGAVFGGSPSKHSTP